MESLRVKFRFQENGDELYDVVMNRAPNALYLCVSTGIET